LNINLTKYYNHQSITNSYIYNHYRLYA